MALWGFVRKHLWPSVLIAVGVIWTSAGIVSQAYEIWTAGLQPWAVQLSGFLIFVAGIVALLFQFEWANGQRAAALGVPGTGSAAAPASVARRPPRFPDARVAQVKNYLITKSKKGLDWRDRNGEEQGVAARLEVMDKLALGALYGWIRHEPTKPLGIAVPEFWQTADLDIADGTVVSRDGHYAIVFFDAHLNWEQIREVWPPRS